MGFTLIELLTVIAVIVILASILIPTVNSIRTSAMRAKSIAQFNQWITAIEGFHQEYGYYPFAPSSGDARFELNLSQQSRLLFEEVLNGTNRTYNRKGISFYEMSVEEFDAGGNIVDAFGNTQLFILIDSDNDGMLSESGSTFRGKVEVLGLEDDSIGAPRIVTWSEENL
jgi:prepilin-type N-terminal cleavage/methylation domain-containing protein